MSGWEGRDARGRFVATDEFVRALEGAVAPAQRIYLSADLERYALVDLEDWLAFNHLTWRASEGWRQRPYARGRIRGRDTYLHRAILLQMGPPPPGRPLVDHINGDSLDNRRANLRWADYRLNALNASFHNAPCVGLISERSDVT